VYFDQGRFAEAKDTLNKALERQLNPLRMHAAHYQLYMTCRKLGDTAEAARQWEIFQKIDAELVKQRNTNLQQRH
jgi:tetratricopeptide (TPR) repeat protein